MKGIDIFNSSAGNVTHQSKTEDLNEELISDEFDSREGGEELFQVDHPAEPEEDQPVKFPLPDFVLQTNEGRVNMKAEYAEKCEEIRSKEGKELLKRAGSKKHHLLKRDRFRSESFSSGTRKGIFGIFQDCRHHEV